MFELIATVSHTFSKNDIILSVRKRYCALGLRLGLELQLQLRVLVSKLGLRLELELKLGLVLGLAEICLRSNVFSSKCSRSNLQQSFSDTFSLIAVYFYVFNLIVDDEHGISKFLKFSATTIV